MREEVAKATLCQPRLTLAPLVHSDQYSITVSSRTKHTPSTPAHRHSHHLYPLLRIYIYIYIYVRVYISISFPSSVSTLQPSPSRPLLHSFSLASFLHYPPALFLFVSPLSPRPTLSLSLSLLFAIRITLSLPGACDSLSFSLRPPLIDSVHASLSLSLTSQAGRVRLVVGPRCSDRKNYRAVFGGSSAKTIESPPPRRDAVN